MTDYKLRLYESHRRELLFDGTMTEAKAAGIELQPAMHRILWGDRKLKVVNSNTFPGELSLWIVVP